MSVWSLAAMHALDLFVDDDASDADVSDAIIAALDLWAAHRERRTTPTKENTDG